MQCYANAMPYQRHAMPCQRRDAEKVCEVCADCICPVTRDWADTVAYRIVRVGGTMREKLEQ